MGADVTSETPLSLGPSCPTCSQSHGKRYHCLLTVLPLSLTVLADVVTVTACQSPKLLVNMPLNKKYVPPCDLHKYALTNTYTRTSIRARIQNIMKLNVCILSSHQALWSTSYGGP